VHVHPGPVGDINAIGHTRPLLQPGARVDRFSTW
jgi:hypothetical protein